MADGHRFRYLIPLFEVDMGQAVYHGNYFHLFELAREALLREIGFGYPELVARQLHLAVVEAHCHYRLPVRYADEIEIVTRVTQVRTRSVHFAQELYLQPDNRLATTAILKLVCINFSGKPVALPPELRNLLTPLLSHVSPP